MDRTRSKRMGATTNPGMGRGEITNYRSGSTTKTGEKNDHQYNNWTRANSMRKQNLWAIDQNTQEKLVAMDPKTQEDQAQKYNLAWVNGNSKKDQLQTKKINTKRKSTGQK